jgi:arylsulfatase
MTDRPNILMITVDSLRADHLGCYGYRLDTSPRIDAFADEGTLLEQFVCSAIPTHPSYTTLYTGQHPIRHGIVAHAGKNVLAREAPMLSELLLEEGYVTCAADNLMRARLWFGRGYEFYLDSSVSLPLVVNVSCEDINRRAIQWLRTYHREQPFFLFLHYWDPHYPFVPPPAYGDLFYDGNDPNDPDIHDLEAWWNHPYGFGAIARDTWARTAEGPVTDPEYMTALYDREIRYNDDGISRLLETVDELGLAENTLVVFVADHGESMAEHNVFYEHHGLYETTVHVPFIARWPGRIPAGRRVGRIHTHTDIAPTVLDAAGIPIPEEIDGRSFWGALTGERSESGYDRLVNLECSWQAKWSLRTERYKLILARQPDLYGTPMRELYDFVSDPEELHNLVDRQPDLAGRMEAELEEWISSRMRELGLDEDPLVAHGVSLVGEDPATTKS